MNKQAIVTLVIGDYYQVAFKKFFYQEWKSYCDKYGLDLIVIDYPIDQSILASQRSPAWQKCILHRLDLVKTYSQIAWIDADIRINNSAPNIFEYCPIDLVSAVDSYSTPTREDHDQLLRRLYKRWDENNISYVDNSTPQLYHALFGLDCDFDKVVQTGVMVFTPEISFEVFEKVYNNYHDKGSPE